MITIEELNVYYKDFQALNICEKIEIKENDRIGLIGSNGAGKTTFVKACLGLIPYNGLITTNVKPEEMSVHMQQNNYVDTMATRHILETILKTKIKENVKLQELISFFEFEKQLSQKYKTLSGGQKQRFTLIMVLMQDAPITFFDEVTTGLDFETRQALIEKILAWYQGKNTSIIFISHYYEELEKLTNKLLILDKGEVIAFGERRQLFEKYCGQSVISFDQDALTKIDTKSFNHLKAQQGLCAISCKNLEEELSLIKMLSNANINYKRSNNDIELLTINALGVYHETTH
ncbi:ATP-binding cassette domain-containing protein [Erysipelothrix urinaevulpis]|uniref:ATP-binding cassette domain-containing protein n=1 Tax=Erysipelothrix urinaevulpis TaxID=2683717 RepID=UPI0013571221|nr:ABC transporter ATP-binding protein [Erysipelothrix urinaevulpis]